MWEISPRTDSSGKHIAAVQLNVERLTPESCERLEGDLKPHVVRLGGSQLSVDRRLVLMPMAITDNTQQLAVEASKKLRVIIKSRIAVYMTEGLTVFKSEPVRPGAVYADSASD